MYDGSWLFIAEKVEFLLMQKKYNYDCIHLGENSMFANSNGEHLMRGRDFTPMYRNLNDDTKLVWSMYS